jgi:hypothetical protein
LNTGWLYLAIRRFSSLRVGFYFNSSNTLDAECAFLDQTPGSDGYIGIELFIQWLGELRSQPIVSTRLVWASASTESCSDAAIVDLGIQPFWGVIGGEHGTNWFTGRFCALLAHYGHKTSLDMRIFTFPISLNMDPMQPTPVCSLILANCGDVIFCLTCDYTCLAAGAAVKIYY